MADEPQDLRPDEEDEEDGGGPVKSFLDHLEDLRWTIIKSAVATCIGMIVCLAAANQLMEILKWPLDKSSQVRGRFNKKNDFALTLLAGTNVVTTYHSASNRLGEFDFGTNHHTVMRMVPIQIGSNTILGLQVETNEANKFLPNPPPRLLNLSPAGGFMVAFQLAIYGGIVLASPFIIYYVASFVVPALKRKEKKYFYRAFVVGTFLFFLGVSFCYFILMPLALNASRLFSEWLGIDAGQWTAEFYISFVTKFMLGMGLGFEMPVILLALVKIGILDYEKLAGFRRYMIVVNLVLGAVLTTPEVLTQVMMAVPLQVLYEITIWIAWYWERQEKKREAALSLSNGERTSA